MKRSFAVLFLLISVYLHAQVSFHPDNLNNIANRESQAHKGSIIIDGENTIQGYGVTYYRCRWKVDPNFNYISGNITTLFYPTSSSFDSLEFSMTQSLRVDSVIYRNQVVSYHRKGDQFMVIFPSVLAPNTLDSVTVYYQGIPAKDGFGSFEQSFHSGTPIIWTLSEPYGASDWWPCKDGLTDKADSIDVFISTPLNFKAASNGVLASVIPEGASHIFHWKHRYPIATYLICLAVTNYAEYSHSVPFGPDTLTVVNYVYPEDSASISAQSGIIVPLIQLFDTLFGIYPFQQEEYGHAQFGWGGGMEHQTMTFVSSFDFELLAHELAHQWFGNKVTLGSWADIWLNEGYATYLSGLAYEHLLPAWWMQFKRVRIQSIISKPGGSVWCDDTLNIDRLFDGRLSYAKGGMILNQLRWIIGDSAFFAASNNYLKDVRLSYGFARTSDLKAHFEASCGRDLTWYFDDWFTGQGFPSYDISWEKGGNDVTVTITQKQSHSSVSFFELPVPLKFKGPSRDTLITFNNTYSGQSFYVSIPFAFDSILVDPDYQLISGNNQMGAVRDHESSDRIQVFPNPSDDNITITLQESRYKFPFSICTANGKIVQQGTITNKLNQVNIQSLAPGIYLFVIKDKDHFRVKKIIKK